jgi:hypothetical protein
MRRILSLTCAAGLVALLAACSTLESNTLSQEGGLRDINSRRQGATAGPRDVADAQGVWRPIFPSSGPKRAGEQRWSLIAS